MDHYLDREEDALVSDLNDGLISQKVFNTEMRELQLDYQAMVEQEAQDAYDDVNDDVICSHGYRG